MTMRRLDRKRLYEVEKLGQAVDVGTSDVMKDALVSASQHRQGHMLTTDMLFDFGTAKATMLTKALAAADPVGTAGTGVSYLCQITDAVFGIVTTVEVFTLEAISDGTLTNFDLMLGNGDGFFGSDAGGGATIQTDIGLVGYIGATGYDDEDLKDKYLYLTSGAATGQLATATIDCSAAVHGNMTNGVDTIRLITSDGATAVNFIANSGGNHDDSGTDLQIKIGGMASAADLAQAISRGIHANANFTTDADSRAGSSTTVTVTHVTSTANSNHDNYLLNDDPQASNGIVVNAFTGGIDDGQAMASGKVLIRVTGFVTPDDLA